MLNAPRAFQYRNGLFEDMVNKVDREVASYGRKMV